MVARVCLILMICLAKGIFFVCEQPRGSLLERHPRFQALARRAGIVRKHIVMQDYGACSEKATWLYSSHPCIADIDLFREPYQGTGVKLVKRDGHKVTGNSKLKASQHYPPGFGRALNFVYEKNKALRLSRLNPPNSQRLSLHLPVALWILCGPRILSFSRYTLSLSLSACLIRFLASDSLSLCLSPLGTNLALSAGSLSFVHTQRKQCARN
jgi:hypothetical protein